jgi:hypothetical protein
MSDAPERIWLQRPCRSPESEWNGEVTWCDHAQEDDDTEYVRADLQAERIKELEAALRLVIEKPKSHEALRVANLVMGK